MLLSQSFTQFVNHCASFPLDPGRSYCGVSSSVRLLLSKISIAAVESADNRRSMIGCARPATVAAGPAKLTDPAGTVDAEFESGGGTVFIRAGGGVHSTD